MTIIFLRRIHRLGVLLYLFFPSPSLIECLFSGTDTAGNGTVQW